MTPGNSLEGQTGLSPEMHGLSTEHPDGHVFRVGRGLEPKK